MYDEFFNERCPTCGGIIGYHINSYGQVVKQCNWCKHIIANDTVATNKITITDFNKQSTNTNNVLPHNYSKDYIKVDDIDASKIWCSKSYEIDQTKLNTIEIKCKTITLKQGEVEITFDLDMQLKDYEFITINGVKFKRVEECIIKECLN